MEAVFEGARRAGGGVNEAMGESRAESLVGDVGEAVVGVVGESGVAGDSGAPGSGVAHRGCLLKLDLDSTAGGFFYGPLVAWLVDEGVELQAATGRPQGSNVGAGARATHPSNRRGGLHAAHAMDS